MRPRRRPGEPESKERDSRARPGQGAARTRDGLHPLPREHEPPPLSQVSLRGRSRAQGTAGASALDPRSRAAGPALSDLSLHPNSPLSLSLSLFSASQLSSHAVFCVIVPEALPQSPDVLTTPAEKSCHTSCHLQLASSSPGPVSARTRGLRQMWTLTLH